MLLLLFLAVVLLLNLNTIAATDWKSVHFLQDGSVHLTVTPYMIVSVIVALLICGAAALLYRRFQYDRVKQLFHRQKLAKMILENGWYESETTQDRGFFKDLPATSKKENIIYFPKMYYCMEHGLLHIRTEITLGKYQNQLLHLEKKLETGLYCELVSKELKDSYVEYILLYDTIANRNLFVDTEVNTTLAFVHTLPDGDREFSFYRKPGADMMLKTDEVDDTFISQAKIFHFGTLSMTHDVVRKATKKAVEAAKVNGLLISFDPNLSPLFGLLWHWAESRWNTDSKSVIYLKSLIMKSNLYQEQRIMRRGFGVCRRNMIFR